ncbi:MAG: hypothetical protein KJ056_12230 [Acidimicrobiia bacterium]|nr:hypothetical protein [Acidimicrobiia bacterium]
MAQTNPINGENGVEEVGPSTPRRKRATGFPVVSLAEAAAILKEAGKYGFDHSTAAFATYMGHSTTNSGAFRQRLAAFRDWKLIAGRGDSLAMTDIARVIAHPTDGDAERRAMQSAFMNSPVFFKLYEESAKGRPLATAQLGSRAVLNLGVAPGSKDKFVQSFTESAVAAGLAALNEDGRIVLEPLDAGTHGEQPSSEDRSLDNRPAVQTSYGRIQPAARQGTPVVHQAWAIDGGSIVFEIRIDTPLPATVFATVGEVVARLEDLAKRLAHPAPQGGIGAERPES